METYLFFEKTYDANKSTLLPIQEFYNYEERHNYEIYNSLFVVDDSFPATIRRGNIEDAFITYIKREDKSLDDYVMYMSYVNKETGDIYRSANLPSFAFQEASSWSKKRYYREDLKLVFPEYISTGDYMIFAGMSNLIKTRNVYLGDIAVE